MVRKHIGLGILLVAGLTSLASNAACSREAAVGSLTGPGLVSASAANASEVSHRLALTAVAGSGTGIVNVTANARTGAFTANTQDAINVHGVAPRTLLYVRAAADVGLPSGQQADGICQRAVLGQFQPLLAYPGGPPATLETSPGGAGATHVVFGITNPFTQDGARLDLVLRLVDALPPAVPTIDLRTACFTLEIK